MISFNFKKKSESDGVDYGNVDNPKKVKKQNMSNILSKMLYIFIALFVIISFYMSYFTVSDSQYAVVTTFGKASTITKPGIHFNIPYVQKVRLVSKNISGVAIGYDPDTSEQVESESLMITLDYNFINADFFIEYQVIDPVKMLYNSDAPVEILENLAQSYIRDTVGLYNVDDVLTTGKYEIQSVIKEKLIARLEHEDIGLQVINVTIQDVEPPTLDVSNAFKAVETAKQGKETAINNANKYKNEKLPAANAEIDQILKTAEANASARVNEAKGQVARFESLYDEYSKFPLITKKRMFYEAMEDILPNLKIIMDSGNGTQTVLPLDSFVNPAIASDEITETTE